jgi:hypothetical protein
LPTRFGRSGFEEFSLLFLREHFAGLADDGEHPHIICHKMTQLGAFQQPKQKPDLNEAARAADATRA